MFASSSPLNTIDERAAAAIIVFAWIYPTGRAADSRPREDATTHAVTTTTIMRHHHRAIKVRSTLLRLTANILQR